VAVAVGNERPGARQERLAGIVRYDEEAVALDGEVGRRRREPEGALLAHGIADIGVDAAGDVLGGARFQDERGEFRGRALVSGRARVGDVVRDGRKAVGLSSHARRTRPHHTVKAHWITPRAHLTETALKQVQLVRGLRSLRGRTRTRQVWM